jgi:hypothetical protein
MSSYLRKCLDITPNGVIRPGSLQDYRVIRRQPWWPALRATSSHLRLWADWPTLQPLEGVPIDSPESPGYPNLLAFDEQIRLAGEDGLKVILMPYRYPRWVNGTAHIDRATDDFLLFQPENRVRSQLFLDWWNRRGTPNEEPARTILRRALKALEYRLPPEGHGPGSRWAGYVEFLFRRYVREAPARRLRVDYLEVVNEPNLQIWPQRSPSSTPDDPAGRFEVTGSEMTVHRAVAEMMATMDSVVRRGPGHVTCLGPSHSDADSPRPRQISVHTTTPYSTVAEPFVELLLDELDRIGFRAGPRWAWSYHNYNDFELNQVRVKSLRAALDGRWEGRRRNRGPALYCTEGGCRLSRVITRFGSGLPAEEVLRLQAEVVKEAVTRHQRRTEEGAGVAMLTQYTISADPNYDCGLLESNGAWRPAFDAWAALPERSESPEPETAAAPA